LAEIVPFSGIRFNSAVVGDMNAVVAPPYDIISPKHQDDLYARHDNNIVRIDFGKVFEGDADGNNRYTRSAETLNKWLDEGVLKREDEAALYLYEITYNTPAGEARKFSGFICLLRLEEWDKGVVLPHEGTLKGPKADRFELFKATSAGTSQVFSLYTDPAKKVSSALNSAAAGKSPDIEVKDDDGNTHRLWAVTDAAAIKTAQEVLAGSKVFIADGHHRYETGLAYRDWRREQGQYTGSEAFNFVPMFLSNMDEEGLTVLPTHRLIKETPGVELDHILDRMKMYFDVEERPVEGGSKEGIKAFINDLTEKGKSAHAFGYFFNGSPSYYLLTLKDITPVKECIGLGKSEAYCNLDVSILHGLVIERVLGYDTEHISMYQPIQFEKDGIKSVERVASGEFLMTFLLNATKVQEVRDVALAREIMPQKSTYFYPKLLTGLVIADLK
jgi:uncharacterized protein (DUF1015 family)